MITTVANGSEDLAVTPDVWTEFMGVPVFYCSLGFLRAWYWAPGMRGAIRARLEQVDVLHVHSVYLYPTLIAALEARRARVPYVLRPAGALMRNAVLGPADGRVFTSRLRALKKHLYMQVLGRIDIAGAAVVQCTSDGERANLVDLSFLPPVVVVPNGVSPPFSLDDIRNRLVKRSRRVSPTVVCLGRIHPVKRFELVIGAVALLRAMGMQLQLRIAGPVESADYRDRLVRRAVESGISDDVTFLPELSEGEKWRHLQEGDVFASASRHENFGLAALEAAAAGLPIVVSRDGGIGPALAAEGAGLIVEDDPQAIAAGLRVMLEDDRLRSAAGIRGAEIAHRRYSWPAVATRLGDLYEQATR